MKVTVHFFDKKGKEFVYPCFHTAIRMFGGYKTPYEYISFHSIEVLDDNSPVIQELKQRAAEEGLTTEVIPIEEEIGTYLSTYEHIISREARRIIKIIIETLLVMFTLYLILYTAIKICY